MSSSEWFDELYIDFYPQLLKVALRLTEDTHLAEDLVQHAFTVLYEKREELISHPNIKGWLVVTLRNRFSSEMQRSSYTQELPLMEGAKLARDPEQALPYWEVLPSSLTKEERLVFDLHYCYGYSHAEIGKFLGCSEAACRMKLYRAVGKCRELAKQEKI